VPTLCVIFTCATATAASSVVGHPSFIQKRIYNALPLSHTPLSYIFETPGISESHPVHMDRVFDGSASQVHKDNLQTIQGLEKSHPHMSMNDNVSEQPL